MNAFKHFFEEKVDSSLKEELKLLFASQVSNGHVNQQTKYRYAWSLSRSSVKSDWLLSVNLFKELIDEGKKGAADCLFHLIYVDIKLQNYDEAYRFSDSFLKMKPDDTDVKHIQSFLEEQKRHKESIKIKLATAAVTVLVACVAARILKTF